MLQFVVDPHNPLEALEDCGVQLDMLTDLLCQGERGGVDLSDMGAAGITDLLRAVSRAVSRSVDIIREVYPAGLQIIEREPAAPAEEEVPDSRRARLALLARLLGDDVDASDILAARASVDGAGAAAPEPRLTEPRPRSRRAA
jgi:hypothetical protein